MKRIFNSDSFSTHSLLCSEYNMLSIRLTQFNILLKTIVFILRFRMEEAIMKMKKRNEELVKENRDAVDSPGSPKFIPPNEQILQLREELSRKEIEHSERIVEMVSVHHSHTN